MKDNFHSFVGFSVHKYRDEIQIAQINVPSSSTEKALFQISAKIVGHEANFHERLFLEAWLSLKQPQAVNNHMAISKVYKCLARARLSRYV